MAAITRIGLAIAWLLGSGVCAFAGSGGVEERVDLRLEQAFPGASNPGSLSLRLRRVDGEWIPRVWGRGYNIADHRGRIIKTEKHGGGTRLTLDIMISSEPWMTGGPASYTLDLKQDGSRVAGTWSGRFRLVEGKGSLSGTVRKIPPPPAGYAPPEPGEHPRLLFRKSDLPHLREKAKTPWGQALLRRLETASASGKSDGVMYLGTGKTGWSLLYALTGNVKWADKARQALMSPENISRWWKMTHGVHDPGVVALEDALTFDLIYDTCDETVRRQVLQRFQKALPFLFWGTGDGHYNPTDQSNWAVQYRAGTGQAALMLLGEKGDYPPAPWGIPGTAFGFEGFTWPEGLGPRKPGIVRIEPDAAFRSGQGVPVTRIATASETTPLKSWLFAGPFGVPGGTDVLKSLGGEARARPDDGTTVTYRTIGGETVEVKFESMAGKKGSEKFSLESLKGRGSEGPSTCYFYGTVDNRAPAYFAVTARIYAREHSCLYIGGERLKDGEVIHLAAGRYPVLVRASLFRLMGIHQVLTGMHRARKGRYSFSLTALDRSEAERRVAVAAETHRILMEEWEAGREKHRKNGGLNPHAEDWIEIARDRCARYADSLGTHGWNMEGEGYTQHSLRQLLPFAHTYSTVMGRPVSLKDDLYMTFPLYVIKTIFGEDSVVMHGYGPGGGPLGVDNWARGFGVVPDRYKPGALWAWDHTQRLADKGKLESVYLTWKTLDNVSTVFRFVNYPLDMKPRNPSTVMPLVAEDKERGGYVFRNRWKDRDDIVISLFLNSNCPGGSWKTDESADFRIAGLGEEWAIQGWGYAHGSHTRPKPRQYMNVLQLSESVAGREATATYSRGETDGSGVVSMDMGKVYRIGMAGRRRPKPVDAGIRGMRSFAVDYSGASGAPCLVAVVDKVSGTKGDNFWQLCTTRRHTITTRADGFILTAPDGESLNATVAAPRNPRIEAGEFKTGHEANYHGGHFEVHFERRNVDVCGGEYFMVLMTLQRDRAPRVCVEGKGPNATAFVGERIVRFDGEKIALDSAPRGWRHDGTGMAMGCAPPTHWNRNGNVLWKTDIHADQISAPVVSMGRVFGTTSDSSVFCISAESGKLLWKRRLAAEAASLDVCLPPAARDGNVYAVFSSGLVAAINGAGEMSWNTKLEISGDIGPPVVVSDGIVVGGEDPICIDPQTGKTVESDALDAVITPPLVVDGIRYSIDCGGALLAIDTNAQDVCYKQPLGANPAFAGEGRSGSMMYAGGLIYVCHVAPDNRTVLIRPGRRFEKVWEYAVKDGGGAWDVPAFANDRMFVRSGTAIYCIGGTTPSKPVAPEVYVAYAPKSVPKDAGLPVCPLASDRIAERWVAAGPFKGRDMDRDSLPGIRDPRKAMLRAGDIIKFDGGAVAVKPVDDSQYFKHFKFTGDVKSIDITAALDRKFHSTGYFFTMIEVSETRYVRFHLRSPFDRWNPPDKLDARVWLAGKPLSENKLIELKPGHYPLMIQVSIGDCGGGKIWMAPRFEDETAAYQKKKRAYDEAMSWWPDYERTRDELFVLEGPGR